MYLTTRNLQRGLGEGHVVILQTLAPGTIVQQVIKTPSTSERVTTGVSITDSQQRAIDRVPWPHPFFKTFMTSPKTQPGPFYNGYMFADPVLVSMGYFKNVGPQTDADLAQYLYNNQDAVNNHFVTCVQEMIKAEQDREEDAKRDAKKRGIITAVIGVLAGLVTLGAGTVVVIAATAVQLAATGWQVYATKNATKDQLGNVEFLIKFLNVSPLDFEKFRVWITNLVNSPPEVPQTPTGVTISSTFSVFKNGNFLIQDSNAVNALSRSYGLTVVGDRLTVKDETSQSVYRVYLRTKDGLLGIPPEDSHLVQVLPDAQAIQMASSIGSNNSSASATSQAASNAAASATSSFSLMTPALLLAIPAALWMAHK